MSYFTAVLARTTDSWKARDVEVDDAATLSDLADALRSASVSDQTVLAVIEHEDEWFALVRVDPDDEPRLFVSNFDASAGSHYGAVLASAADVDVDHPVVDVEVEEDDDEDEGSADEADAVLDAWAGDPELLEDLGVSSAVLRKLTTDQPDDPGAVLAEIGEMVGFGEMLEALR